MVIDYITYSDTTQKFVMVGRPRTQLLLDYITSFEHGQYELPIIPKDLEHPGVVVNPLYRAHRAVTVADVYAPGKWNSHLPDDFAAMSLAHHAIEKLPQPTNVESGVPKSGIREADKRFNQGEVENVVAQEGGVTVVDERYNSSAPPVSSMNGERDMWEAMSV